MFINKTQDGRNNLCGTKIAELRKAEKLSQRQIADKMQLMGYDLDKNAIQRIEAGKRFVIDVEIKAFSELFGVGIPELLGLDESDKKSE